MKFKIGDFVEIKHGLEMNTLYGGLRLTEEAYFPGVGVITSIKLLPIEDGSKAMCIQLGRSTSQWYTQDMLYLVRRGGKKTIPQSVLQNAFGMQCNNRSKAGLFLQSMKRMGFKIPTAGRRYSDLTSATTYIVVDKTVMVEPEPSLARALVNVYKFGEFYWPKDDGMPTYWPAKVNKKPVFRLEDYPGDDVCMICEPGEEAKAFRQYLHSKGKEWHSGRSYRTHSGPYPSDRQAFFFNEGCCGRAEDYEHSKKALRYSDFDWVIPTVHTPAPKPVDKKAVLHDCFEALRKDVAKYVQQGWDADQCMARLQEAQWWAERAAE